MNLIKKVFDAMGAALAVIVITPWIMWLVKYTFDNSRVVEDILPNVLSFIGYTLLYILLGVGGLFMFAVSIRKLIDRYSPTPIEYSDIDGVAPPSPPPENEIYSTPSVNTARTYSNQTIAEFVIEWFELEGIDRIKRGTFANGFTDIFNYLQLKTGYVQQGENQILKMNNLITILVESKAFYLDNDYLILSKAKPEESRMIYAKQLANAQ